MTLVAGAVLCSYEITLPLGLIVYFKLFFQIGRETRKNSFRK